MGLMLSKLLLPLLALPVFASEPVTSSAELILLPVAKGEFTMGSPATEKGRSRDEKERKVTLTKDFHLSQTEITQKQWTTVMGTTFEDLINKQRGPVGRGANLASKPSAIGDDQPMCFVNWHDAVAFCEKLTAKDIEAGVITQESRYTLPTEAQWEYACRAGTMTPFSNGESFTSEDGNFYGKRPYGTETEGEYREKSTPVKTFAANQWGFHDMHGNLYEWCADWYEESPTSAIDPTGPEKGDGRMIRGGAWDRKATSCRAAYRYSRDPNRRAHNIGFRVALVKGDSSKK